MREFSNNQKEDKVMKKLSILFMVIFIFGLSTVGDVSAENVLFEGIFERGNTTMFESAISSKGSGHNENGKPVTQSRNFPGSSGEAALKVCNGPEAEKISSAEISINGIVVLGTSNFNQNVGCIEKMVNLDDGDNILEVQLKSKPGGKISIEISQPDSDDTDGYPNVVIATTTVGQEYGPYGGIAVTPEAVTLEAVTPGGDFAYVSNYSEGKVYVIKTSDNSVIADITVGIAPIGVSLTHDGKHAYVSNSGGGTGTVSVIDTNTNSVTATIDVGVYPFGISMLPDSDRDYAYVSDFGDAKVYVIDTLENIVIDSIDVGPFPFGISVAPDGAHAYVSNFGDGTVSVIDTNSNDVIATIPVGNGPFGISVTPNSAYAYVSNSGGFTGTVSVIDTAAKSVIATIPVGNGPTGVAVTPNGRYVYVSNSGDGTVSVIQTSDNTVIDTIEVGKQPFGGIAVSSDGKSVFVGNYEDGTVSVIGF
jgi:YVTN family beta-propeller protein